MLTVEKAESSVVICPECGTRHYSIFFSTLDRQGEKVEGAWRCDRCGFVFTNEKDIPEGVWKGLWKSESVDGVRCDGCRQLISCTPDNYWGPRSATWILCPTCNDGEDNFHSQHPVAIRFRGKWFGPGYFLKMGKRNGFLPADSLRERIALAVMNQQALNDDRTFRMIQDDTFALIRWLNGQAVGYYTSTGTQGVEVTLHQLFVRREFRNQGHGTELLQHFYLQNPQGEVLIEAPNEQTKSLLEHLGYMTRTKDGGYIIKDQARLGFVILG